MKLFHLSLLWLIIIVAIGCGRAGDGSSTLRTTSANYPNGGLVDFKIISKTNTLLDKEGNYRDSGHYSILYQAKTHKHDLPLAGLDQDEFYTMYENDKHIDESKFRVNKDNKTVSNKILLLLDFSGSIVSDCDELNATNDPSNLCYQIVSSSKKFIDSIVSSNQLMSIYYFNSQRKPLPLSNNADPTDDKEFLKHSLDKLYDRAWRKKYLEGYNSTNLYGAIKVAADDIICNWFQDCIPHKSSNIDENNKKHYDFATLVVFTDGRHTVGNNVSPKTLLSDLSLYQRNYYYTIGLGKDVDDKILKEIGKDGYLKADETKLLDTEFENLAQRLNAFANSFYKIDYCPAQQEGKLDLRFDMHDPERNYHGVIEDSITLFDNIDFRCDIE